MKRSFAFLALFILLSLSAQASQEKVEVFVTSWCPYCRKLEGFLKQNKIDYTRYDVENDEKGAAEFDRLGGEGVPLVRVGKDVIHGYDPEAVLAALKTDR